MLQNTEPILKTNTFEYQKNMQSKASSRSWQQGINHVFLNALTNLSIKKNCNNSKHSLVPKWKNQNTDISDATFDRHIYHISKHLINSQYDAYAFGKKYKTQIKQSIYLQVYSGRWKHKYTF